MKKILTVLCLCAVAFCFCACNNSNNTAETEPVVFENTNIAETQPAKTYPENFVGKFLTEDNTVYNFNADGTMHIINETNDTDVACEWFINENTDEVYIYFGASDNLGIFTYKASNNEIILYLEGEVYETLVRTDA